MHAPSSIFDFLMMVVLVQREDGRSGNVPTNVVNVILFTREIDCYHGGFACKKNQGVTPTFEGRTGTVWEHWLDSGESGLNSPYACTILDLGSVSMLSLMINWSRATTKRPRRHPILCTHSPNMIPKTPTNLIFRFRGVPPLNRLFPAPHHPRSGHASCSNEIQHFEQNLKFQNLQKTKINIYTSLNEDPCSPKPLR